MTDKVTISLTPHNALAILAFMCEFLNDENRSNPEFQAIHEALDEYQTSLTINITEEQIDDAVAEAQVNFLLGKSPQGKEEDDDSG